MMLGFGMVGLLLMLLLWGGLIALAVWLVSLIFPRAGRSSASPSERELNARQIIDRRYARGELTPDQYELMRQDLE